MSLNFLATDMAAPYEIKAIEQPESPANPLFSRSCNSNSLGEKSALAGAENPELEIVGFPVSPAAKRHAVGNPSCTATSTAESRSDRYAGRRATGL
jgi:hypothetical protein